MKLPSKNADLYRRLLFGCLLVSFLFKGRGCQLPGSAKLSELSYQKLELTRHGECRMKCRNITEAEIREVLKTGKVNYDKSEVRDKPCGTYAVEGKTADGQEVRIVIADCDTISRVVTAIDLKNEADTCKCE
jgi:hypothetical protein